MLLFSLHKTITEVSIIITCHLYQGSPVCEEPKEVGHMSQFPPQQIL